MRTTTARTLLAAAAAVLLLSAAPVAAEIFHVELANGNVFDTRYQPEEASWDASLVLFLTDTGNWMAVPKEAIASITSETENQGFGKVINTTTVMLGYSANDAPLPGEESQFSEIDRLQQLVQQQGQQDYSVQQFVEPGEAGGTTGGLPAYGATAPPSFTYLGGLGVSPAPAAPAPASPSPAAPAPAAPAPVTGIDAQ